MHKQQTAFENIVEKEEIAHNKQFLLFPQCFILNDKIISLFVNIFDFISLFAAELEGPKIGKWGKRLKNGITVRGQIYVLLPEGNPRFLILHLNQSIFNKKILMHNIKGAANQLFLK